MEESSFIEYVADPSEDPEGRRQEGGHMREPAKEGGSEMSVISATDGSKTDDHGQNIPDDKDEGRFLESVYKARRQTFRAMADVMPRIPRITQMLLEFFVKRTKILKSEISNYFPYQYFCRQQVVLSSRELVKGIKHERIAYQDFRDMFINLHSLHEETMRLHKEESPALAAQIHKLIQITGEIATVLEACSKVPVTDFRSIGLKILTDSEACAKKDAVTSDALIPMLAEIEATRLVGAGGFGAVYKSTYKPAGLICTMKLVAKDCFTNAASACMDKVSASVTMNSFVVQYFCSFEADKVYITLMEYIRGVDFMKVQDACRVLSISQACQSMAQMILAVQHMHFRGMIHRDIKVSNALIMATGRIKLIDFDTNKCCIGHFAPHRLVSYYRRTAYEFRDRESCGTPSYIAPEVYRRRPYGRSIDWWSIGVMTFRLFVGKVPFRAKKESDQEELIISAPLSFPNTKLVRSQKSRDIKDFIERSLNKLPIRRLGSKDYAELLTHPFFKGIDWKFLGNAPNTAELANIPSVKDVMEKMQSQKIDLNKKPFSPEASSETKREKLLTINDVADLDKNAHVPIFTYVAPVFREFQEKVRSGSSVKIGEYFLSDEERKRLSCTDPLLALVGVAPSPEQKQPITPTLSTVSATSATSRENAESVDVVIQNRPDETLGFETSFVRGDGDKPFHLVTDIAKKSAAESSSLCICDVLVSVNDKDVQGMSKVTLDKFLKTVSQSGDYTTVTVLSSNPVRMCRTRQDVISRVLVSVKPIQLDIVPSKKFVSLIASIVKMKTKQSIGLDMHCASTFDEKKGTVINVFVLKEVQPWAFTVKNDTKTKIYPGDVVVSLNSEEISQYNETDVMEKLAAAAQNKLLKLTVLPLSPVRQNRPSFTRLFEITTDTSTT